MPQNYYFGGGGDTFAPFAAIIAIVVCCLFIYLIRRRYILVPLFVGGILLPYSVSLAIAGINFPALRILVTVALLRVFLRRDVSIPKLNRSDHLFLAWALSNAIAFSILWATVGAVVNRVGFLWTTLGCYFVARAAIRDEEDVRLLLKVLGLIVIVIAPCMVIEHIIRHNIFSILGAPPLSDIRNGSIRAHGPFGHAIIAGTIGAILLPFFVNLWRYEKSGRAFWIAASLASATMAITSASSTPLMSSIAGMVALAAWPIREKLRIVRWAIVIGLVSLQIVMKAPVWFLINRVGGSIGGSGYHRAMLIDSFVQHFGEWWLFGTQNNAAWGYDMWDVDNAFVAAGTGGGLLTFILFIWLLVEIFRRIGTSRRVVRGAVEAEHLIWSFGACMFANVVGFFGIIYFDQSVLIWYSLLAAVSATAALAGVPIKAKAAGALQIHGPQEKHKVVPVGRAVFGAQSRWS